MPVLGTKLHVPTQRRQLVPRARLTAQLQGEPRSLPRLVLVSAAAGFGKTTLLAQWLASGDAVDTEGAPAPHSGGVAWLSLDGGDAGLQVEPEELAALTSVQAAGVRAMFGISW